MGFSLAFRSVSAIGYLYWRFIGSTSMAIHQTNCTSLVFSSRRRLKWIYRMKLIVKVRNLIKQNDLKAIFGNSIKRNFLTNHKNSFGVARRFLCAIVSTENHQQHYKSSKCKPTAENNDARATFVSKGFLNCILMLSADRTAFGSFSFFLSQRIFFGDKN